MHRIDTPGHDGNQFRDANPAEGIAGTVVDDEWLNAVQEELVAAIEENGLVLEKGNRKQLSEALKKGRLATVVDIAALKAISPGGLSDGNGAQITTTGQAGNFYWNADSTDTDDDIFTVKPDSVGAAEPGRWKREDSYLEEAARGYVARSPLFYSKTTATASLILDGGYIYNLETASEYLITKDVKAAFAIPTHQLRGLYPVSSSLNYGTTAQLAKVARMGHEVINHGLSNSVGVGEPLDSTLLEQEVSQSYRDLRATGVGIKGWVSYFSDLDPANVDAVIKKHAISFGEYLIVDARDFGPVTIGQTADISNNRLTRANIEAVVDESGNQVDGTDSASIAEKLRILKLLADYCVVNNRHVVFYHHDVSNGKFPQEELGELIDYCNSIGLNILSPAEQFQQISNVSIKETKIEALEYDIGELFSREGENLIANPDLRSWQITTLSGTAPTAAYSASKTTCATTLSFVGDSTGAAALYFLDIPNASGMTGGGGQLSFSFGYRSNVDDAYSATPPAVNGKIRVLIQFLGAAGEGAGGEIARTEKTYAHIDGKSRIGHVSIADLGHAGVDADFVRVVVEITPGDGTARDVIIENPVVNRGEYAARFRRSGDYSVINQTIDANLAVGGTWEPVMPTPAVVASVQKFVVTAGLVGEVPARGFREINPAVPGTYTILANGGDAASIFFTLDENFKLTVDSVSGTVDFRIKSAWAYG